MQKKYFRVRGAKPSELVKMMKFYLDSETDTLPPPSYLSLKSALDNRSLLVIENIADSSFVATAGYFDYIKSLREHQIFELAGTRVTKEIGGLRPLPLQQILLALRLIQLLVTEGQDQSISVISSARHPKSIENLIALGMVQMNDMPEWLEYNTCSWTRMTERSQWQHFVANSTSIEKAIEILQNSNFLSGYFDAYFERNQEGSNARQDISIEYDLNFRKIFPSVLKAHEKNKIKCNFTSIPSNLT